MRTGHISRRPGHAVVALVAVVLGTLVALVPSSAQAHAMLEESNPGPDTVLSAPPATVWLRFSEDVNLVPGSLRVFAPDGTELESGEPEHPDDDATRVQVALPDTRLTGSFVVAWRVVSADSHPIAGAFDFAVGQPSADAGAAAGAAGAAGAGTAADRPVGLLLGVTRWLGYLGVAGLLGGAVFLLRCWPAGLRRRGSRRLLGLAGAVVGGAALLQLLLKGPYDVGAGVGRVADPGLVGEVLGTTYGRALLARLVLLAAILLLLRLLAARPAARGRPAGGLAGLGLAGLGVAGLGLAVTFSLTGHAAAGSPRWLALASDTVHVVAMSLWLGGLLGLGLLLARGADRPSELKQVVERFSPLALGSVAALVATGAYQSWRQVGGWAALGATAYGRELLVKLALVALVLAAALVSRRWVQGRVGVRRATRVVHAATGEVGPLRTAEAPAPDPTPSLRTLRRSVAVETLGVLLVLGVTATLVATEPAESAYRPTAEVTLATGPDAVRVTAVPDGDRRADLTLVVTDADGRPVVPAELTATLALPAREIAGLPVALTPVATGRWRATVAVPVAGTWSLTVTVRTTEIDQFSASTPLDLG